MYIDSYAIVIFAFVLFFLVALSVMLVLWIAMPFSVFGIKGYLKRAVEEQEKTNALLRSIVESNRYRCATLEEDDMVEKREDIH